jgi:UDP-N-acetylmuramoylalanine--D-glutamate ligase
MDIPASTIRAKSARVTVMGLGRHSGGVAAAQYLAARGAMVTVTDLADRTMLAESLQALARVPIAAVHLGGHQPDDFTQADLVVVNPAVRPGQPLVQAATRSGATITSETELFLRACPAHVIGVTGTVGKSTTAAMIAAILEADRRRTWLGGNIGLSLLPVVHEMTPDDWVVLELSSFQLAWLSDSVPMPGTAVVTNCTSNHLDWHGTRQHYVESKRRLLAGQSAEDLAVLNLSGGQMHRWRKWVRGRLALPWPAERTAPLWVPGVHNRHNAACAAAAAAGVGCSPSAIERGLAGYRGLPHRLQFVADVQRRRFFNDSKATTPEAATAALAAFDGRKWLLAGGHDQGARLEPLAEAVTKRTCGAAFFGATACTLQALVARRRPGHPSRALGSLAEAFNWCWPQTRPGDLVLLSPACSSPDQFCDYQQRGAAFVELVDELACSSP